MACPKFEKANMLVYLGGMISFNPEVLSRDTIAIEKTKKLMSKVMDKIVKFNHPVEGDGIISAYLADKSDPNVAEFKRSLLDAVYALIDVSRDDSGGIPLSGPDLIDLTSEMLTKSLQAPVETTPTPAPALKPESAEQGVLQFDEDPTPQDTSIEDGGVIEDEEREDSPGSSDDDTPVVQAAPSTFVLNSEGQTSKGIGSIIKTMLGPKRAQMYDDMVIHFHKKVSDGWIQQEVDSEGKVVGFISVAHSARNILANIKHKLAQRFAKASNGEMIIFDQTTNKASKYLYFNEDRIPEDSFLFDEGPGYKIYKHSIIREGDLSEAGVQTQVVMITGESMDAAIEALRQNVNINVTITKPFTESPEENSLMTKFDGVEDFTPEESEMFFDYIIATNYPTFLKSFYPQLSQGFRAKYRTGFVANTSGVSAADSESAATKMHKATTPRLKFVGIDENGNAVLEADDKDPYLRNVDFDRVMHIFQENAFPRDKVGLEKALYAYIKENRDREGTDILASIYFRFFAPNDFKVSSTENGLKVNKTFRSYASIAVRNKYQSISYADYLGGVQRGVTKKDKTVSVVSHTDGTKTVLIKKGKGLLKYQVRDSGVSGRNTQGNALPTVIESMQENLNEEELREAFSGLAINQEILKKEFTPPAGMTLEQSLVTSLLEQESSPWETNNDSLDKSLSVMINTLSSAVPHESFFSREGRGSTTNSLSFGILSKFKDEMASPYVTIGSKGKRYTKPDLLQALTIHPAIGENSTTFEVTIKNPTRGGKDLHYVVTLDSIKSDGKPKSRFPFTIVPKSGQKPLSGPEISKIFRQFPLPSSILSPAFASEFNANASMLQKEQHRSLESFLLTTALIMEMNQEGSNILDKGINTSINASNTSKLSYDPVDLMNGYSDILKTSLGSVYGTDAKVYSFDNEGNKVANISVKNKLTDSIGLAIKHGTDSPSIHKYSTITGSNPRYKITGYFSKTGIRDGETVKANGELSIHEQAVVQIEQAFLQQADINSFQSTLIQFGAMSDRKDVPLVRFESTTGNEFMPIANDKLDTAKLQEEYITQQQGYWSEIDRVSRDEWKTSLENAGYNLDIAWDTATLQEIADKIAAAEIPHEIFRTQSDLVENMMIGKSSRGHVEIPGSTLQSVAIFGNDALAAQFTAVNLRIFKAQMKANGFTAMSASSKEIMGKRFTYGTEEAEFDALLTGYFFHSNTLGGALLNLHTGGTGQYDGFARPAYRIDPKKGIIAKDVLKQAGLSTIIIPETNQTITLAEASLNQVRSFGTAEQLYTKSVLVNDRLVDSADQARVDQVRANTLVFDDVLRVQSPMYVAQVKRNAGMGSTHQHPRLNSTNEAGMSLGQHSKQITITDPENKFIDVIGKSGYGKIENYDAVQMGHPLYFIRLAFGLGGEESGYSPNGAPVKDITNAVSALGFYKFQKKATFDMFNNELLGLGTPELYNMLVRMNSAITFEHPTMFVHAVDPVTTHTLTGNFSTKVTSDVWLSQGENLGQMLDNETGKIIHAQSVVSEYKAELAAARAAGLSGDEDIIAEEFAKRFSGDSPRYSTDKVAVKFENLQDLWEYFGSTDNDQAWGEVAWVLGNTSTNATRMDLSDATYANRDSYVEKVGFKTQQKTGTTKIQPAVSVTDENYTFEGMFDEVDNTYHGVILQADHNPDTTSSEGASTYIQEEHENAIPMITQVLSACVGEGNTALLAGDAFDAIGTASEAFINELDSTLHELTINSLIETGGDQDKEGDDYKLANQGIISDYLRRLASEQLSKRDDPGIVGELVGEEFKDMLSFDLKQVLPLMTSLLNSKFNKNTVRQKFKGGQFVVSPSHDFVKSYVVMSPDGKTVVADNLSRKDLNFYIHNPTVNPRLSAAILASPEYELAPVNLTNIMPSDIVTITQINDAMYSNVFAAAGIRLGGSYPVSRLRRMTRGSISSEDFNRMLADTASNRLGKIRSKGNVLNWTSYSRYSEDGTVENIKDTNAFKAFQQIDLIAPDKRGKVQLTDPAQLNIDLVKMHFFSREGVGQAKIDANPDIPPIYLEQNWSKSEEEAFNKAYALNAGQMQIDALDYIKRRIAGDPFFRKTFEKKLITELEHEGWTTKPAEFYMPSMHAAAYLIEDGTSIVDITGGEDPDFNRLISLGLIRPGKYSAGKESISFKDNEDIRRYMEQHHTGNFHPDHKSKLDTILRDGGHMDNWTDAQRIAYDEVMETNNRQYENMVKHFHTRVRDTFKMTIKKIINAPSIDTALKLINRNLKGSDSTSELSKLLTRMKAELEAGQDQLDNSSIDELITEASVLDRLQLFKPAVEEFYHNKASKMASGFTTTLEFITARIPAQGMQSFTAGKTKNFIFSTRNSCYGPLEMLVMTGADYDIDKQNMMTWAVSSDGEVIDWIPFLDNNGKMSYTIFKEDWLPNQGISDAAGKAIFDKANQNFIVHKIMTIAKSPINAVQANTPISTDKASAAKRPPNYNKASTSSFTELALLRDHASSYNPYSIFKYEKLNMDGANGIGIFASDLKSYFAAYYATVTSNEAEKNHIEFRTNSGLDEAAAQKLGVDVKSVQFFDLKTGELKQQSSTLANSGKFVSTGKVSHGRAAEYKKRLAKIPEGDSQQEYELLMDFVHDIGIISDLDVDEQAWEDLSELLSAATDNAKVLILGEINATANTSSIISTMIRMGIDLKYALQLVGHSDPLPTPINVTIGITTKPIATVRELFEFIESAKDTTSSVTGNNRLLTILEKMQPSIESLPQAEKLANPFRQLFSFASMSEEFSLLSSFLSINQGLKNSTFDSWKFRTSLTTRMNDILSRNGGTEVFDLKAFTEGRGVQAIIRAFDKNRIGINVPFVLSKNTHYFGYYRAMFKSLSLLQSVSSVDMLAEDILAKADSEIIKVMDVKKFKSLHDYIYSVGVELYMVDKPVTIDGRTFDLAKPQASIVNGESVDGRLEFIEFLPTAVKAELEARANDPDGSSENYFLESLPIQNVMEDYETKISIPILKGPDLSNMSSERFSKLQMGLAQLAQDNPALHAALFQYSLITTKGGYAGGSFMGLYETSEYADFSEFIKNNGSKIKRIIQTNNYVNAADKSKPSLLNEIVKFNNPFLLTPVTTSMKARQKYKSMQGNMTNEDAEMTGVIAEAINENMEQQEDLSGENRANFRSYDDIKADNYDVFGITSAKIAGKIKANIVVSKETGIIYKWKPELKMWFPHVRSLPNTMIPYNSVDTTGSLKDTGFSEGWRFQLSETNAAKDAQFANIISYVDGKFKKSLGKNNGELAGKLGISMESIQKGQQNYLVKTATGYRIMTKAQILDQTDTNISLHKHRIVLNSIINRSDAGLTENKKFYKDTKTGAIYYDQLPSGRSSDTSAFTRISPARVGTSSRLYGQVDTKALHKIIKEKKAGKLVIETTPFSNEMIEREFKQLKKDYLDTAFVNEYKDLSSHEDSKHFSKASDIKWRDAMYDKVDQLFDPNMHILNKVNIIYSRTELLGEFDKVPKGIKKKTLPKKMPSAVKAALMKPALMDTVNWATLQKIFKTFNISGSKFKSLVQSSLMGVNGPLDMYVSAVDSAVIFKKGMDPRFYNDRKVTASRDHTVPESYRHAFNKKASVEILNKLSLALNKRFPNTTFSVLSTEEIRIRYGKEYATPDVKAFVHNGEVIINSERATLDSPLHEFTHVYMQHLKVDNPQLYLKIVKDALKHPLAKHMKKSYPNISSNELGEEVFVSLVATQVSGQALKNNAFNRVMAHVSSGNNVLSKVKNFFKSIFGEIFGIDMGDFDISMGDSLGNIINKVGDNVVFGKGSMLASISPETQAAITQSRSGADIDYAQAKQFLIDKGFIKIVCT